MFRIKICGVTDWATIDAVASSGADAVGLNFHPPSVRYVAPADAAELSQTALAKGLTRVGVFVAHSADQIASIADSVGLDFVQLHGDQTAEDARWLLRRGFGVIPVVRLPTGPLDADGIETRVAPWRIEGVGVLLDADAGAHGGGVGMRLDWDAIGRWATAGQTSSGPEMSSQETARENVDAGPPADQTLAWALAGGLDADTVAEAIGHSGARSIDVASGVEEPRGKKSPRRIAAFVAAARRTWASQPVRKASD
jgi:phosphoribosylanthranilate isomerase